MSDESTPRVGTGADATRRLEARVDSLETRVEALVATVTRVEANQTHASDIAKLRFDAVDTALRMSVESNKGLDAKLTTFIARVESLISGETQTAQTRSMLGDYEKWRAEVDQDREEGKVFHGQIAILTRALVVFVGGNALAVIGAIAFLVVNGK